MQNRVKKLAVAILVLIVVVAVIFATFIIKDGGGYEYGSVDIKNIVKSSEKIVLDGVSFSVSAGQLWETAQTEIWAGVSEEEAYAHAEKALIEKYAMYYKATANGIVPDEEAMRAEVELNREVSKTASNYEDFRSFLAYLGMTHDEYWDSQYTNFLEYDVINQFKQKLKNEFVGSGKNESDWESYYSAYVADAVKNERIRVIQNS